MGIVSLGRSLVVRQFLLAGLLLALGSYAYCQLDEVSRFATSGADAAAVAKSAQGAGYQVLLTATLMCLLMLSVAVPFSYYTISRPIRAIAETIDRLASGEFDIAIVGESRTDEIG